jgi:pSer/pThr/pTyr-binding forkhead associated (FHA) protein
MRAQLIPADGGNPIEISRDLTLVGRKEDCDLCLDHKSVSKMHCVIVKTDGLLLLRDLGSTNGTRVNGQRVRRAALLPNDLLAVANFKFRVYLGPDNMAPPIDDRTHQMSPEDGVRSADKRKVDSRQKHGGDRPDRPIQPNELPDVYPEDASPKASR